MQFIVKLPSVDTVPEFLRGELDGAGVESFKYVELDVWMGFVCHDYEPKGTRLDSSAITCGKLAELAAVQLYVFSLSSRRVLIDGDRLV